MQWTPQRLNLQFSFLSLACKICWFLRCNNNGYYAYWSDKQPIEQGWKVVVPALLFQPSSRLFADQHVVCLRVVLLDPLHNEVRHNCRRIGLSRNLGSNFLAQQRCHDVQTRPVPLEILQRHNLFDSVCFAWGGKTQEVKSFFLLFFRLFQESKWVFCRLFTKIIKISD